MALSLIGVGTTANDGTGDPLRTAFQTVNTALAAVNNAVVVGTGVTTFKDDSGTYGVAVASNGDVTFTNAGATTGMTWDASAASNAGGLGIGTNVPLGLLHLAKNSGSSIVLEDTGEAANQKIARCVMGSSDFYLQFLSDNMATAASFLKAERGAGTSVTGVTLYGVMTVSGNTINVTTQKTPASAGATGTKGDIVHDTSYIYVCTATNTWKRAAIATW